MKSICCFIAASISWSAFAYAQDFVPTEECPLLGPAFSSNFDLSETDAFVEAIEAFPDVIEALFESGLANGNASSFVIDVFSGVTNDSLYTYTHHATAPEMNETFPPSLDDGTIFRIGSVSKLLTVYAILTHTGSLEVFDHPVTQYLPELAGNRDRDPLNRIVYEEITIGALASHQGGTGTISIADGACTAYQNCDPDAFLERMRDQKPAHQPPFASSLYSDGAYGILGLAFQRMTNQSFSDALTSTLIEPLNLTSLSASLPNASTNTSSSQINAITIPGAASLLSAWGLDNPITAPSGGIYASTSDMRKLGLSIMHHDLLSPVETRRWMKPLAHTSSLTVSIGAPWEIYRLTLPQSSASPSGENQTSGGTSIGNSRYRISDLYTKAGGQPGYTSVFMLSPDHQLGITVQVAGASAGLDRWTLRAVAAETFVAAAERAGREVAARTVAGTFVEEGNDNNNLTLAVEDGRPGIGIEDWSVNGTDVKSSLVGLLFELAEGTEVVARLYPTGLVERTEDGGRVEKWRAVREIAPWRFERARVEDPESLGWFDDRCATWLGTADVEDEEGRVNDEFLLEVDGEGMVVGVRHELTGSRLRRIEE